MERVDYQHLVIQDLLNLYRNDELDLDPWYQRRSVWTRPQKAYLINTLFVRKPVPTIYIRHHLDIEKEKSIKEVVDGQQRIRSIVEYAEDEFAARHPDQSRRLYFGRLAPGQKRRFLMTPLSVGYLIDADDSDVIEIFGRLNSVAKTLNPQEKRNARFSGEFKQFCLRESAARLPLWRNLGIFTANDIARMQEVQFVSDLVLNMRNGLSDYSSAVLDKIYNELDDEFEDMDGYGERLGRVFDFVTSVDPAAIKDTIFSRSPVFFSLVLVLDQIGKLNRRNTEASIYAVDAKFNTDVPVADRPTDDAEFYLACTSSTQRIRSRRVRAEYIRQHFE